VFLIATLAFPAEVAMIPGFTLTKGLGLLNTYWALILPGLASGMGIFILKGFFDSLPLELYEAAALDGAGEFRIFWQITLPLSSPIIAVNALAAFVSAYTSWNWALLICQDPSMWTIAVYLFQFQIISNHQGLIFASLIVGSIPTLLIFLFCQRIIMRGIVLPSLK
jgi:multiple sugar transport system permease protein